MFISVITIDVLETNAKNVQSYGSSKFLGSAEFIRNLLMRQ
jgi:hypothetical protein